MVGATCGILVALFAVQPFGTARIGAAFAPIVIIWLGTLAGFGIYNLIYYDAGVFVAFNPGEAFSYLIRNKEPGWHSLSGVLLAFTGVEALFADLGAFSKRAIQISWLGWCLPCLVLAYTGQAAYISVHPEVGVAILLRWPAGKTDIWPGLRIPSFQYCSSRDYDLRPYTRSTRSDCSFSGNHDRNVSTTQVRPSVQTWKPR